VTQGLGPQWQPPEDKWKKRVSTFESNQLPSQYWRMSDSIMHTKISGKDWNLSLKNLIDLKDKPTNLPLPLKFLDNLVLGRILIETNATYFRMWWKFKGRYLEIYIRAFGTIESPISFFQWEEFFLSLSVCLHRLRIFWLWDFHRRLSDRYRIFKHDHLLAKNRKKCFKWEEKGDGMDQVKLKYLC